LPFRAYPVVSPRFQGLKPYACAASQLVSRLASTDPDRGTISLLSLVRVRIASALAEGKERRQAPQTEPVPFLECISLHPVNRYDEVLFQVPSFQTFGSSVSHGCD